MKLEDLYLINKEEWLDVIKDQCKIKAKNHFWVGLVLLIPLILFLIVVVISIKHYGHEKEGFVYLLTPEQLLNKFKKYVKDKSIIWTIGQLIFCGWFACFVFFSSVSGIMKVFGWIFVLVPAIVHSSRLIRGKYFVGSNDEDIIRRLQELIGEE